MSKRINNPTNEYAIRRLKNSKQFRYQTVETYDPHKRRTSDLFHFIDILAIGGDRIGCLGIQTCSLSSLAAHVTKCTEDPTVYPALVEWLHYNNRFEIWGWSGRGPTNSRKLIQSTDRIIQLLNSGTDPPLFDVLSGPSELGPMIHPARDKRAKHSKQAKQAKHSKKTSKK